MPRIIRTTSLALIVTAMSAPLAAQQPHKQQSKPAPAAAAPTTPAVRPPVVPKPAVTVQEAKPGLLKRAKITPEAAERTALEGMMGGKILSARIEEHGTELRYQFRVDLAGQAHDVGVDALTGKRIMTAAKH
ncbi:MAG: PepSY domain-containing protein [Gemmatimonadales bacterium]